MAVTAIVCAILTAALTVVVDPYRMYGTPSVSHLSEMKPMAYRNSSFVKEYLIDRVKPRTLLLGNSRVEVGLNPESPLWPEIAKPVFNGAESGADLATAVVRLYHGLEAGNLQRVIVAADFPDFLRADETAAPKGSRYDERRLQIRRDGHPNAIDREIQLWKDRARASLTIDALLDAIETPLDQNPSASVTMTSRGFNPLHNYAALVRDQGYHALFLQKAKVYIAQYADYPPADFSDPLSRASFRDIVEITRVAVAHNIHLTIFINPYHSVVLELWHADGLWPVFEDWKRALVKTVTEAAGGRRDLVTILDFSGYSSFAIEPVPAANDLTSEMQWYWEAGHYKSQLGDRIIARVLGKDPGFGQELTEQTITGVLADIDAHRYKRAAELTLPVTADALIN